jgi:hypothetical protein
MTIDTTTPTMFAQSAPALTEPSASMSSRSRQRAA